MISSGGSGVVSRRAGAAGAYSDQLLRRDADSLGVSFADDDDRRSTGAILFRKVSAGEEVDTRRLEIARRCREPDAMSASFVNGACPSSSIGRPRSIWGARPGSMLLRPAASTPGSPPSASFARAKNDAATSASSTCLLQVSARSRVHDRREHPYPQHDAPDVAHERARAGEKQHRDRDLGHEKHTSESPPERRDTTGGLGAQRAAARACSNRQARPHSEEECREHG